MLKKFQNLQDHHKVLFALIIGFAIIQFWRGIWGLTDYFVLEFWASHELLSYAISIVIGIVILFASGYLINTLSEF